MTDTTDTPTDAGAPAPGGRARKAGLDGMLLPELKQLASGLGLKVSGMRKGQLVDAIKAHQSGQTRPQGGGQGGDQAGSRTDAAPERRQQPDEQQPAAQERQQPAAQERQQPAEQERQQPAAQERQQPEKQERRKSEKQDGRQDAQDGPRQRREQQDRQQDEQDRQQDRPQDRQDGGNRRERQQDQQDGGNRRERSQDRQQDRQQDRNQQDRNQQDRNQQDRNQQDRNQQDRNQQDRNQQDRQQDRNQQDRNQQDRNQQDDDDEQGGSRRNRRRRGRDRQVQGGSGNQGSQDRNQDRNQDRSQQVGSRREPDLQILEDDVLAPCAGILDLMDNYAFVRTSSYLPGPDDVYVSMSMVRKHGLRRGDAVVGQVRQPREGERREKFNPLVRIDSINGGDPEVAGHRVDFAKLTPIHPSERLRTETGPQELVGRVVDLVAPLGKGQRALVVAPPRSGRTAVLQALAAAVTSNNPECHLMVVLLDERPEELTDFERSVKGEVIGSSFDRAPADHTLVAELALERAKRLVELGHDVVLLVDGLTRLGRAYNLAATGHGRSLPGGVDVTALHPPKQFFGAARNVENGGSLTIVATALVETGSTVDEVIFEELRDTANAELRLRRELAERRLVPAVDPVASGTRREDLLLGPEEAEVVGRLRASLAQGEPATALGQLLEQLRGTSTNLELLRRVPTARRR